MTVYFPKHYLLLACLEWLWHRGVSPRACDLFRKTAKYCSYWVYISPIVKHEFAILVDENAKKATLAC